MNMTNNISRLFLLHQHESELAFTSILLTSKCGPSWKDTRNYCIFRAEWTQEASGVYM